MAEYKLNSPTWSCSQYNTFSDCKRQYFYEKYWSVLPDEEKWNVWKLKYMTSLPMLKGNCIHDALKKCILNYKRGGSEHNVENAIYFFRKSLREKFNESHNGEWRNPKLYGKKMQSVTNLFEHYYHDEDALEKARQAEETGIKAIESLWKSPIWKRVLMTPNEDFLTVDEDNFPNFNIVHENLPKIYDKYKDIKVYAIIDLAIKYGKSARIIDWKTGKVNEGNKFQLAVYALYANDVWKYEIGDIKFYMCYLNDDKTDIKETEINVPTVRSVYNIILDSYREMVILYNNGSPKLSDFPMTQNSNMCAFCKYKEVCIK